ncbi:MAG TPA: metalloregulator ArsR/SmtB family transcription factor [Ignavibacteriaceae bacterium]|nr:metalloregulator ArsR/SmtB family transcription factor [Ignavibacteriaceae bacterium]
MEKITNVFKALSDSNRLRILKMLQDKPLCSCEIREVLGLASSTVSQHLAILKKEEFILEEREGKFTNFKINHHPQNPQVASLLSIMNLIGSDEEIAKKDKSAAKKVNRFEIVNK